MSGIRILPATGSAATLALCCLLLSACTGGRSSSGSEARVTAAAQQDLSCPCEAIEIDLSEDLAPDAWLDIRLSWDGTHTPAPQLQLEGPPGESFLRRGFDAWRYKLPAAVAGRRTLTIDGAGQFSLRWFVRSANAPKSDGAERLPNIVVMVPEQIAFGACDAVEQTEQNAQRCLRLGNAIGNTGDGPLEVHLGWVEAAQTFVGEAAPVLDGYFFQRVYQFAGSPVNRPVGSSDFHAAHAHWHYDGFADFRLYAVDPLTGLRGNEAAAGHKSGFCFLDWGRMAEPETRAEAGGRAEQDCLIPMEEGWSMGISAGWFDFYWSELTDQYLEASGVADGLYELVSIADPDDWLRELDETDNAASVLIEIQGDEVRVLERRGWYSIPPGTTNL